MKTSPLFSIIIPAHNSANTIKRAINSINFTEDVEVIIVENASKDNTLKISKEIKNKYIKVFSIDKASVGLARNYGIRKASGEYIVFLDSDDELIKGGLSAIKYIIKKYKPDIVRISGREETSSSVKLMDGNKTKEGIYNFGKKELEELLLKQNGIKCYSCLLVIKKDKIRALFDEKIPYCEDLIFYFDNLYGRKVYMSNEQCYFYHYEKTSATKTIEKAIRVLDSICIVKGKLIQKGYSEEKLNEWSNLLTIAKTSYYMELGGIKESKNIFYYAQKKMMWGYYDRCWSLYQKIFYQMMKNNIFPIAYTCARFKKIVKKINGLLNKWKKKSI